MSLDVQVFSDMICPWCYVGKRRLESALAARRRDVRVRDSHFDSTRRCPKRE